MNVVVLNGSPRHKGNTEIMVEAFAQEARAAGHEVQVLSVGRMNIAGCKGCGYCLSHEGACVNGDDMTQVAEALKGADVVAFASPIYWFDITSQLKAVIDRMYRYAATGFPFHKTALLLDAGDGGPVFDAAITQYKASAEYCKWEDAGIVCVPNMEKKGSMAQAAQLDEVRRLARSL